MRVEHQIKAFEQILEQYDGAIPLHRFLPVYFKQHKNMGSSDRRWASRYLYSYFRMGGILPGLNPLERLAIGDFLCHQDLSLITEKYLPEFKEYITEKLEDKIGRVVSVHPEFKIDEVFPFHTHLSADLEKPGFYASFFRQPDLFIRVSEGSADQILAALTKGGLQARKLSETAIALPNGSKLEGVLESGLYQVQDLSSQHTGHYFKPQKWDKWWDCCAASGGKSLLLHSLQPVTDLLVSDLRASILINLDERFRQAGILKYHKKELDLLQNNDQVLHHYAFDGIILDAPCTGSGTWGRTPEMLRFFDEKKISQFAAMQKTIIQNVVKNLKSGKPLIYITCSAFAAENEMQVKFMTENLGLKLEEMELIKGYHNRADTMFVARLIKD